MKRLLTILALAGFFTFGVQTTFAQSLKQDQNRPEAIAKEKARVLTESLGLTGDQTRAVFRAYVTREVDFQKNVQDKDLQSAPVKQSQEKINQDLQTAMKKILTAEQYANWEKDQ